MHASNQSSKNLSGKDLEKRNRSDLTEMAEMSSGSKHIPEDFMRRSTMDGSTSLLPN